MALKDVNFCCNKMSFVFIFCIIYVIIHLTGIAVLAEVRGPLSDESFKRLDCRRMHNGQTSMKDDGGFQIRIDGNPTSYTPQKEYTVYLENESPNIRFSVFYLVIESSNDASDVGKIIRIDNIRTMFSDSCPNTIMYTSTISKSQIQVSWTAPVIDSGCVVFKATVLDLADHWYEDNGRLTLQLCQGELDNTVQPDILEECCACEEAMYELVFECLWSEHTHPRDFPADRFRTNFSTIMGSTHTNDFRMWQYNEKATQGIAELAEDGNVEVLQKELKEASNHIRTVIKIKGLTFPKLFDRTFTIFRTDKEHHLLSILSKLIPSPDWVVGVTALELCLKNCSWIHSRILNLFPIDIGVVDGITYNASKTKTVPQAPIRGIKATYPTPTNSPFYDVQNPVAKIIITRQRLFQKDCKTTVDSGMCATTEWTAWSTCTSTCGKGIQKRTRNYLNGYSSSRDCRENGPLIDRKTCYARDCNSDSTLPPYLCKVSEWSSWSECACAKVYRVRYRKYEYPSNVPGCSIPLKDQERCPVTPNCPPPEECGVSAWSEWSPCSVTCGEGFKTRSRKIQNTLTFTQCNNVELIQNTSCNGDIAQCENNNSTSVCFEQQMKGPCQGYFPRWYYDSSQRRCETFIYGGCHGNGNRFDRYVDCNRICEIPLQINSMVVDCQLTEWTEWSPCSRSCGTGRQDKRRMVEKNAEHGGKPCPPKLVKRRKCEMPPCNNNEVCSYLPWSEWSICSATCGIGYQYRRREINKAETPSGVECTFQHDQKHCYLPSC